MKKHYVILNNGDRVRYPAPKAWEYIKDTSHLSNKIKKMAQ